ncbi:regulatory protein RecX [Acinetobacter stercoris]|uniref:Regulatory protein RecX n=1 Tax=Acinetobacter stercoris TaxID=2126983 RepID=A0A2U3MUA3_9GAMM|nr:regulatory protein RecX [Acinetobacter stercoris]SPL69001.1 Regulatory protein RecX [Acinetobacter stercoris]
MSDSKFPKMLDYEKLKQQFGQNQTEHTSYHQNGKENELHTEIVNENDALDFKNESKPKEYQRPLLTGSRLRSYAFAVLTRKEYSKADLIEKLALYAADRDEVITLVDELARENYQSDQRVAEMTLRSQVRKGKGPNRIKLALRTKQLDKTLVEEDLNEINWYEQAYQLKVKKYGTDVSKDPKLKAKQIRFLQYRGFDMDSIMKAITRKEEE